jgi:hypothetical protein
MRATIFLVLGAVGLAAPLATPAVASPQTFYGMAGGSNLAAGPTQTVPSGRGPVPNQHSGGFTAQASFEWRVSRLTSTRLDGFFNRFTLSQWALLSGGVYCMDPLGPCPYFLSPSAPVGVAGLVANELVNVVPSMHSARVYVMAGVGAYYFYEHPSAQGAVRPGLSLGAGCAVPRGGPSRVFLEVRYHYLLNAPSEPAWFAPMMFGIQF